MGATLVNRQSSLRSVGKPSWPKRAMAAWRSRLRAGRLAWVNSFSVREKASRRPCLSRVSRVLVMFASSVILGPKSPVPLFFQFQGQLLATGANDFAFRQNVDLIGNDVFEQSLIVRDDDHGPIRAAQGID